MTSAVDMSSQAVSPVSMVPPSAAATAAGRPAARLAAARPAKSIRRANRISSHLVSIGTAGNELGATTIMTTSFLAREHVLRIIEAISGLRMNNAYIR
ncbi:MAG: hypothetical protein MUQ32_08790, partial [Chloroflexi bacterium]|nr:hypothetical protein [Chloroflexota bacterium]